MSNEYGQGEQALSRAAGMVAQARGELDAVSRTLMGNVEAMRSQWGGQGAVAFQALATAWNEKQQRIVGALDEFESNLVSTERDNLATDDSQSSAMTSLQASLGQLPHG